MGMRCNLGCIFARQKCKCISLEIYSLRIAYKPKLVKIITREKYVAAIFPTMGNHATGANNTIGQPIFF